MIVAQGGRFAGWSLYVKDGVVKCVYNWFDTDCAIVEATEKLLACRVNIRYHFDFDDGQPGPLGKGLLHINEQKVEDRINKTVPFIFSADEAMDIGGDMALLVTDDYPEGEKNQFKGVIHWVQIDLEEDNVSHLEPEEFKCHRLMVRRYLGRFGNPRDRERIR